MAYKEEDEIRWGTLGFFAKSKDDQCVGLITCKHIARHPGCELINPDVSKNRPLATVEVIGCDSNDDKACNVDAAFAPLCQGIKVAFLQK